MVDIAEKLFPNVWTMLAQLIATGIIFLLYRRYVHKPVMAWLDRQTQEFLKAQNYAEEVEEKALIREQELQADFQKQVEHMHRAQELMKQEAQAEREEILKRAQAERLQLLEQADAQIEREKIAMLDEVEAHIMNLAVNVTERTLENYQYDEEDVFSSLEKELEKVSHETD